MRFLDTLGYRYMEETLAPVYQLFLCDTNGESRGTWMDLKSIKLHLRWISSREKRQVEDVSLATIWNRSDYTILINIYAHPICFEILSHSCTRRNNVDASMKVLGVGIDVVGTVLARHSQALWPRALKLRHSDHWRRHNTRRATVLKIEHGRSWWWDRVFLFKTTSRVKSHLHSGSCSSFQSTQPSALRTATECWPWLARRGIKLSAYLLLQCAWYRLDRSCWSVLL